MKVSAPALGRVWGRVWGRGPALVQERVLAQEPVWALGWVWAQEAPARERAPEPGQAWGSVLGQGPALVQEPVLALG